jgi:hypothetical protein
MKYLKLYDNFSNDENILIIVDVQKSFKKFFTENYLKQLQKYCKKFDKVYQIFDNHHEGKDVDRDYLYEDDPNIEDASDLYQFPNQVDTIEKRYNYDVDVNFYRKILSKDVLDEIKSKGRLSKGDYFPTTEETIIVYIGNNHQWFHVPIKLYNLFKELKQAQRGNTSITIVGGASGECLDDIITSAKSLGLEIKKDDDYIYSAKYCPIK